MLRESAILLLIAWPVVLLSGLVTGLTGFGFGLVAIPAMVLLMPPKLVVPTSILLGFLCRFLVGMHVKRDMNFRRLGLPSAAAIAGSLTGALVLSSMDSEAFKFAIGLTILGSAAALLQGARLPLNEGASIYASVGFVSGLLHGSTGMGGPPVALLFANRQTGKRQSRADLTAFLFVVSIIAMAAQFVCGLITADVLRCTMWMSPATLVGALIGMRLADRMSNEQFRKATLWLVLLTGAVVVVEATIG